MTDTSGHDPHYGWSPPPPPPAPASSGSPHRRRRMATAALAGVGGVIAGVALAFSVGANASTTSSTPPSSSSGSSSSSSSTATPADGPGSFPEHGTAAHEDLEKPVTGTNATKAQAAAVKSVGSGTAGAVTTDVTGKGYEVTVTKSDGSKVEVHLDSSFAVENHGPGGH